MLDRIILDRPIARGVVGSQLASASGLLKSECGIYLTKQQRSSVQTNSSNHTIDKFYPSDICRMKKWADKENGQNPLKLLL
jgi:hypothetical protein